MEQVKLIGPFAQLLPMSGLSLKGALSDAKLPIINQGGLLVQAGKIISVGVYEDLKTKADQLEVIEGEKVCIPGLIDAHTHICFGGSRANDYAMRNAGSSYLEIAKAGGGIWDTVIQTRKATKEELVRNVISHSKRHLANGVTTLEVKSGYGLSVAEELKMLRAIQEANHLTIQDLISTCLAAHLVPKDWEHSLESYLSYIQKELFPLLIEEGLTNRIDAFIEEGAFSPQAISSYFQAAQQQSFDITVHADQFHTGGSKVALDFKAVSADHLEASTEKEIMALAQSDVVAVALPGATIGLGCSFAPARKLLDAGAILAIASDHNPGSAPMGNLLTQAAVLGTFEKLTNTEILAGLTYRAAHALKLSDRGRLEKGYRADFICFPTHNYQEITYHQGQLKPNAIWKNGESISFPT